MSSDGEPKTSQPKVAIIGMSCLFPGAPDLPSYWSNIVGAVDSIRAVTDSEWNEELYYDPDATTFGKTYSRRGGFISEYAEFDPLKYGVMPSTVKGSDPDQFLTLKVAHEALHDAGYSDRDFNRDRAEVILGRIGAPGAGSMNLIQQSKTVAEIATIVDELLPDTEMATKERLTQELQAKLTPCNADTIPGVMPNVLAGRIAAKLGFRGRNLLIDAACASSMVAIETAVNDLVSNRCDLALAGGLHVNSSAALFNLFCGLGALSRNDTIKPFDDTADGTLLGEGIGIICLKRLDDAVADGDRIYATICGVASTSDGFGGSVISPSLEGEALAMTNAYEMAGIDPRSIELLEAHGTATPTGDAVEMQAIAKVFGALNQGEKPWCAVGSVKSMIGHCQSASAVAGVIKAALSLYHKTLPPTINVKQPNSKVNWKEHPCYINTDSRPWVRAAQAGSPRRAAVSAFGFGGINSHAVLEEFAPSSGATAVPTQSLLHQWDTEVVTFAASTTSDLIGKLEVIQAFLSDSASAEPCALKDLAFTLNCTSNLSDEASFRAAFVTTSCEDLTAKLTTAVSALRSQEFKALNDPDKGFYFTSPDTMLDGSLAFVYPGLGSAYTGMLAELCAHFPEVQGIFDSVDSIALAAGAQEPPSRSIFPQKQFDKKQVPTPLAEKDFAVVAVLLAEYAIFELLKHLQISPDSLMGCSTGEFAVITMGGAVDVLAHAETFYRMSTNVARSISKGTAADLVSLRVLAAASAVTGLFDGSDIYLTADLGNDHVIVTGSESAVRTLAEKLRENRMPFHALPSAIPYHTPLVERLVDTNDAAVTAIQIDAPLVPVWSCSSCDIYPSDSASIRAKWTKLFEKPILLRQTIENMYASGVRKFVEIGPNGVLTALIHDVLRKRPHLTVASNLASRSAISQLNHLLGALFVQNVSCNFNYLYARRNPKRIDTTAVQARVSPKLLDLKHTPIELSGSAEIAVLRNKLAQTSQAQQPIEQSSDVYAEQTSDSSEPTEATVLEAFLQTNAEFYNQMNVVQQDIMSAFLSAVESEQTTEVVVLDLPLLQNATMNTVDESTVVNCPVSLNAHQYLLDHAVGGLTSSEAQSKVYLMPLMVALEIMAESAYAHVGWGSPVRVEQVKAFKRIVVGTAGTDLRMVVSSVGEVVRVQLFQNDDTQVSMMADYCFAESYEPLAARLVPEGGPPSHLTTVQKMYSPTAMFHGPRMQSCQSIDRVSNKSIGGTAFVRPSENWVGAAPAPNLLIDPLLLDNGSQFVLFYLYEKQLPATALLPFFIESIEFSGAPQAGVAAVSVNATLTSLSERRTESTVEIQRPDGTLWCRLNNIHSRRVALSPQWQDFVANPVGQYIGQPLKLSTGCGATIEKSSLPDDDVILDWCLDYILVPDEYNYLTGLKTDKRRSDWLLGRIAAKEAVRRLVAQTSGKEIGPHNIHIVSDSNRVPSVVLIDCTDIPEVAVSVSHTADRAVAIACFASQGSPGIDLETIQQRDGLERMFLNADELVELEHCAPADRPLELTKFWCAKEALFKSLRNAVEMSKIKVRSVSGSLISLSANNELFEVHTSISDGFVIAHTTSRLTAASLRSQ